MNKADNDNLEKARIAQQEYMAALHYLADRDGAWSPPVLTVSAQTGDGLSDLWQSLQEHRAMLVASGGLESKRQEQLQDWIWTVIEERLLSNFRSDSGVQKRLREIEAEVGQGRLTATVGADELVRIFRNVGD